MAGQTSLKGATQWVRLRAKQLASSFGLKRPAMPWQMTSKRILEMIDAEELNEQLSAFLTRWEAQQRCAEAPRRLHTEAGHLEQAHIAIDGKTVRATSKEDQPVHQLSAYDVKTGVVLFQVNGQEKENEISALKPLLTASLIKDRIFTLDAMHRQTELCAKIDQFAGAYILVAKDNQPTLREDLALFFDAPPFDWSSQQAQTWDKGHGGLEHRHIICSPDLNAWFAKRCRGVGQVFRLQPTTPLLKTGDVRKQTVYGISNLSLSKAPAVRMLALNRAHWGIENRLHWRRDVTLGEDRCQTRTGVAPGILACLNSAILSLMDRLGVHNVARQARFFDALVQAVVLALLSALCSVF